MWISLTLVVLAAVIVLLGLLLLKKGKAEIHPMGKGMALGGMVGALVGIALVEFWSFEYPVPFILWMLGMAGGQLAGWLLERNAARRP